MLAAAHGAAQGLPGLEASHPRRLGNLRTDQEDVGEGVVVETAGGVEIGLPRPAGDQGGDPLGETLERLRRPGALWSGHGASSWVRLRCTRGGTGRALSTGAEGGASVSGRAALTVDRRAKARARVPPPPQAHGRSPGRSDRAAPGATPSAYPPAAA